MTRIIRADIRGENARLIQEIAQSSSVASLSAIVNMALSRVLPQMLQEAQGGATHSISSDAKTVSMPSSAVPVTPATPPTPPANGGMTARDRLRQALQSKPGDEA